MWWCVCRWLTFIRGVVDSDELPLNVGREILQKSRMLQVINKRIAAKSVEMMKNMKQEGGDKWRRFWDNYGKYIKVCIQSVYSSVFLYRQRYLYMSM